MATFLAVFSIISGTASLLGLYHVFKGESKIKFKKITLTAFCAALLISFYMIFVPGNYFENSVKSKIQRYSKDEANSILIQQGDFSWGGMDEYEIMFPEPFKSSPQVEIINVNGYKDKPHVQRATKFKVIVDRSSVSQGFMPQSLQNFIWVAQGEPLDTYK